MAQRHQHRSAAKQHAPETGPAIPCVYWMLAEVGTRTDRDVVGILAENTTVSKANASGNNMGPGPQLPPHPRAKGESEPLLFRGPVHCMLIHNSSKLGEGSRASREQGLQRLHVIPRTSIARMASHPLGNSPCLLCTGWAAICDGHRAALPRESAVEGIEIVEEDYHARGRRKA